MKLRLSALCAGTTLLVGCASPVLNSKGVRPFEGFNRTMYNFNFNVLIPMFVRPVAVTGVIMSRSRRVAGLITCGQP